jgi:leader peptidase (prepilin peptidase) / N-methyltransferase
MSLFYITPTFAMTAFALVGLCIGSFLNVVIYRLPKILEAQFEAESLSLSLSHPPSTCGSCGHRIRWFENIPIVSFIFLRGRCSACHAKISLRYPLIELATSVIFAYCAWRWHFTFIAAVHAIFGAALLTLSMIDWDTSYLPDEITVPLTWGGLVAAGLGLLPSVTLYQSLVGACVGYLSLWLINLTFKKIKGCDGMGGGDFKLFAAIGAWLGWQALIPVVYLAACVGLVLSGFLIVAKKVWIDEHGNKKFPFGPDLAFAAGVQIVIGDDWFYRLIEFIYGR